MMLDFFEPINGFEEDTETDDSGDQQYKGKHLVSF